MPRLLVIAAEASADVHAASVVRELRGRIPELEAFGMAGPSLRAVGVEALARTEDVSVMGLVEVLPALPRILGMMNRLEDVARERRPDAVLLVDSPDLNLRMARRLRSLGAPILYYIAPMVWAWRRGRVKKVARLVDRLCVILPFEEPIWTTGGVSCTYVGHPLFDQESHGARAVRGETLEQESEGSNDSLRIALLPGSRRTEVRRCLPPMLGALGLLAHRMDMDVRAVVPVANTLEQAFVSRVAGPVLPRVALSLSNETASTVLQWSDAAIITSGTATLEALFARTPMVVVYGMAWPTWVVARLLVRTQFVSLPNLLAGRQVVSELLQGDMHPARIADELSRIVPGGRDRDAMMGAMATTKDTLGGPGAAGRVAEEILSLMSTEGLRAAPEIRA